ncbi:NAD-dependent epimerase/dehydratase family protein [Chloroflexota bacterium]
MRKINKYFITGGAGFIGSYLTDRLIGYGEVTVYDNLSSGRQEFIKHHIGKSNFHFVQADLLDRETLIQSLAGHDMVFHLACNSDIRKGTVDTSLDLKQGVLTTHNLLEAMIQNDIKNIVFTSSSAVYGEKIEPMVEHLGPLLPISLYGASKLCCEGFISAFCHLFDIKAWIFRIANVVGGRASHGVINDFIIKLKQDPERLEVLGDGKQRKSFLYINDCIDGILFGVEYSYNQLNLLNLGTDSYTDVAGIANMVIEAMGLSEVKIDYSGGSRGWKGDVPSVQLNSKRMRQLGFQPSYTSDQAISKAITDILGK